jgi:hypothetical protein
MISVKDKINLIYIPIIILVSFIIGIHSIIYDSKILLIFLGISFILTIYCAIINRSIKNEEMKLINNKRYK